MPRKRQYPVPKYDAEAMMAQNPDPGAYATNPMSNALEVLLFGQTYPSIVESGPPAGVDVSDLPDFAGDKGQHATAFGGTAALFGPTAADALGVGKETFTGLLSLLQGGDFMGPQGFDPYDIEANRRGIEHMGTTGERGMIAALFPGATRPKRRKVGKR